MTNVAPPPNQDFQQALASYRQAVVEVLKRNGILGFGPLLDVTTIGKGGYGFVLRGYIHLPEHSRERVRWLVVKAPVIRPCDDQPDSASSSSARLYAPQERYYVDNEGILVEHETRSLIGGVHGLGPIPKKMEIDSNAVLAALKPDLRAQIHMTPDIVLLVFELLDERVVHVPPADLASFVNGPVDTARELLNFCEIARSLGSALLGLHEKSWIHRDIKLANVVAQMEDGLLRSVELIDLGAACRFGEGHESRAIGLTEIGTDRYYRPARRAALLSPESAQFTPKSPVDEDIYAFASLLARVLLGKLPSRAPNTHPDAPYADEIERRVAERASREADDLPLSEELGDAFGMVHELLVHEHGRSAPPLTSLLRRVERLRIAALGALSGRRFRAHKGPKLIPELLASLEVYIAADDEDAWCKRYLSLDLADARRAIDLPAHKAVDLDAAVDMLRLGYVTLARRELDYLLQGPSDDPVADARGLRIYVGGLLLREGEIIKGHEVLDRYDGKINRVARRKDLAFWIDMLRARLRFHAGGTVPFEHLRIPGLDDQQEVWLLAFDVLVKLRSQKPLDPKWYEGQLLSVRSATSTPELLFAMMQIARAYAHAGELVKALRWLHAGISEAAAREFPVEYTSMLLLSSRIVLGLRESAKYALERAQIDDIDALFQMAERLALRAAELFGKLDIRTHRDYAIRTAGECARARGTFTGSAAAACWYELAAANTVLSGRPLRWDRIDELGGLRSSWAWLPRDPGTSEAQLYYNRYGWAIEKLWGTGGLSIERLDGDAPARGAIMAELLADSKLSLPVGHILVVGCGTGGEVLDLARTYEKAKVHGIDVSSWSIDKANRNLLGSGLAARCSFKRVDLLNDDPIDASGSLGTGPWDLVIMRETLAHVTFKRSFLRILRGRLAPETHVRMTELVQRRPSGPLYWRSVLQCMGLTNLASPEGLCDDVRKAGFEITSAPIDMSEDLTAFFINRWTWFDKSDDPVAVELRGMPLVKRRTTQVLGKLIDACERGLLGWVRLSARIGPEPEAISTKSPKPFNPSSMPPR